MGLEVIIFAGATSLVTAYGPKLFGWLWKRKGLRKIPKEIRGPLEVAAMTAAKSAATAAVKQFAKDMPPPIPSRGKK